MSKLVLWADEYESGYDSDYDGMYDVNFVFQDEEDMVEESQEQGDFEDTILEDDIIMEEVPFVYCPGNEGTAEA